jgi:hypothetical protein
VIKVAVHGVTFDSSPGALVETKVLQKRQVGRIGVASTIVAALRCDSYAARVQSGSKNEISQRSPAIWRIRPWSLSLLASE